MLFRVDSLIQAVYEETLPLPHDNKAWKQCALLHVVPQSVIRDECTYTNISHKYIKTKLANTIWYITQSCLSDVDYCALFASSVECNYSSLPMFVEPPWMSNYSSWMHWCDYLFMSQSELTFCKSGPRLGLCCSLIKEWVAGKGGHTSHVSSALTGSIR